MFRRRPEEPQPVADPAPPPATVTRPRREPTGIGLRATPSGLGARLRAILTPGAPATEATWEQVEEALIAADVGASATLELVDAARARAGGRGGEEVRRALAEELRARLERVGSGQFDLGPRPSVILVVGVNGTGKTTTVAKLAARLQAQGLQVALGAGDTFRAAAIEQLRIWGEQLGAPVVAQRAGADPGAVAFDAVSAAESRGLDAVIIDTAGRLQSKTQLMAELGKVRRVIERRAPGQPRHVLLVLDATTGQNGLSQAEAFSQEAGVTGIVLTKLDGTAKGGIALAIAEELGVPVKLIGIGETIEDLRPFDAREFASALVGE